MTEQWHFTQASRWASDAADQRKLGHHDVAERYEIQAYKHLDRAMSLKYAPLAIEGKSNEADH